MESRGSGGTCMEFIKADEREKEDWKMKGGVSIELN